MRKYAQLYTEAYTKLEKMAAASLESAAIKSVAVVSHGLGKVIEKIPVVERGQLDENLIATGKRLEEYKADSVDDFLAAFRTLQSCQVKQFTDLIHTIDEIHNGEPVILLDNENVYVQLTG